MIELLEKVYLKPLDQTTLIIKTRRDLHKASHVVDQAGKRYKIVKLKLQDLRSYRDGIMALTVAGDYKGDSISSIK